MSFILNITQYYFKYLLPYNFKKIQYHIRYSYMIITNQIMDRFNLDLIIKYTLY